MQQGIDILFLCLVFFQDFALGKKQFDVGEALAESLCLQTKLFVKTAEFQPALQKPIVKVNPDECWIWRWIHCDPPQEAYLWCSDKPLSELKPCGTWDKVPCPGAGEKSYCEKFQCGWTLDELHLNWGYNPEHIYPNYPRGEQSSNDIIETGMTLDFCDAAGKYVSINGTAVIAQ